MVDAARGAPTVAFSCASASAATICAEAGLRRLEDAERLLVVEDERSLRLRTTLAAVAVVGVALLARGITLVAVMRRTLTDGVRAAAVARAADVSAALAAGTEPARLTVDEGEEAAVQVLGSDGRVVAPSPNLGGAGLTP